MSTYTAKHLNKKAARKIKNNKLPWGAEISLVHQCKCMQRHLQTGGQEKTTETETTLLSRCNLWIIGANRQSARGEVRANLSVSMTTVVNKHAVCGGLCTAVLHRRREISNKS